MITIELCVKCYERAHDCKCNTPELYKIDDNIIDVIITLNKKGYITGSCCGGHIEEKGFDTFILFRDIHEFPNYPEGFKYSVIAKKYSVINEFTWNKKMTKEQIEAKIEEKVQRLRLWANNLESIRSD